MAEPHINGVTALEMTMRDVLDGMEEFTATSAWESTPGCFEILSIEPPPPGHASPIPEAKRNAA